MAWPKCLWCSRADKVKVGLKTKAELTVQRARVEPAGQGTRVDLMEQETTKAKHKVQETTKAEQMDLKTIKLEKVKLKSTKAE